MDAPKTPKINLNTQPEKSPLQIRIAKITTASTESAAPYKSVGGIYRGLWINDTPTERDPIFEDVDVWTSNPVGSGDRVLVTHSPFGRWEGVSHDDRPWTAGIFEDSDLWNVKFYRCGWARGSVTRIIGTSQTFSLPVPEDDVDTDYWVGVKIDTVLGTIDDTLLCSTTAADVYDATPPSDKYFKRLLYTFQYVATIAAVAESGTIGEPGYVAPVPEIPPSWQVKEGWYRLLPELGAYV